MTVQTYWIGKVFIAEWTLVDVAGAPVSGATVTGTVTLPAGGTAGMTITPTGNLYRASYQPVGAGLHAYRLVASGTGVGAEEGTFVVHRDLVGALPITLDPTQPVGLVRLLVTDVDESSPLFTDAQINGLLSLVGGRVRLAAAEALDTIATSEVLVSKVIKTQDLQTDGSKVAAELRARAAQLRATDDQYDGDGNPYGVDIVDYDPLAWFRNELAELPEVL